MKKIIPALACVAALAGCQTTTSSTPQTSGVQAASGAAAPAGCVIPGNVAALRADVMPHVNAERAKLGRGGVSVDPRLQQAAQAHACFLARSGQISHRGEGGTNSMQRARAAGVSPRVAAENLAWGYTSGAVTAQKWTDSPKHYRNMVHPSLARSGVGVAQGPEGLIWVMLYTN